MAEYSYNGWPASKNPADFGGLEKLVVAGESFMPGVRAGDVATVLRYVAEQMHRRVEPVVAASAGTRPMTGATATARTATTRVS